MNHGEGESHTHKTQAATTPPHNGADLNSLSFSIDSLGRTAQPAARKSEGRQDKAVRLSKIRAVYDAAQTTDENYKHWDNADSNSANKANDASTRQTLRDRSRYECENNGYASGLVEGIANDVIGTGPRLQLSIPGVPRSITRAIATAFDNWSEAADFPEDLRILHQTKVRDGEGFAVFINNPRLLASGRTGVSLDLKLYEAEQVSDPWDFGLDPDYVDGIRIDAAGEPVSYTFTRNHPGGVKPFGAMETQVIDAASVIHWFKAKRPGQRRGIPETSPGLPLFAQLRRYTLATLGSAEFAAMLAGIMQTDAPADGSGPVAVDAMDEIELTRNHLLTLPAGWKAEQFDANQPTTNYPQFKAEILGEIGRGVGAPFNVVAGNSSGYNYSSGRLDHLLYHRAVKVERRRLIRRVINRLFTLWAIEASIVGIVPAGLPPISQWSWKWFFDGFDSIDPSKDSQTNDTNLRNGTTTLAAIYGENGEDWEDALEQRAREIAKYRELGIPDPTSTAPPPKPAQAQPPVDASNGYVLIRAVTDANGMEHDEDGKFGEGGGGSFDHKKEAATHRERASHHDKEAKKAAKEGDHEGAAAHREASRTSTEVAKKHEEIHTEKENHKKAQENIANKKDAANKKVSDAERRVDDAKTKEEAAKQKAADLREKHGDPAARIAELKRQLAESKKRSKELRSS